VRGIGGEVRRHKARKNVIREVLGHTIRLGDGRQFSCARP
jgi:hypothetical protein